MSKIKRIRAILENLAFFIFCMVVVLFLMQLFCFTSFRIPSDSMEPALKDGDRILVNKMIRGGLACSMCLQLWIMRMSLSTGCPDGGVSREMIYWFSISLIR